MSKHLAPQAHAVSDALEYRPHAQTPSPKLLAASGSRLRPHHARTRSPRIKGMSLLLHLPTHTNVLKGAYAYHVGFWKAFVRVRSVRPKINAPDHFAHCANKPEGPSSTPPVDAPTKSQNNVPSGLHLAHYLGLHLSFNISPI